MDYLYDDRDPIKYFLMDADLLSYLRPFRDILKITKVSQLKYITKDDLASIGFTRSEIRRYRKTYEKCYRNPYFSQLKGFIIRKKGKILKKKQSITTTEVHKFTEAHIKVPTKHIIAIEDISINVEIGVGQFGVVQQGTWTTRDQRVQVAIKCVGPGMTSNSSEFLKEAAVMHSIDHPNIVRLFGVVLHSDTLMLVTELAPLRSLLECLRDVGLRLKFPVLTLCDFAEQICDGMAYLENKRLIHRDLAARNILVFNKNKVKISDFGLSRALGVGKDYYQTNYNVDLKLPVAWCAPECILYLRFTSASDVWAFGVCLWEMFSYGFKPWAAFSGQKILEAIDKPKCQRLERPDCCPGLYYSLMLNCWSHDPSKRPKFRDLRIRLRAIRPDEVITLLPCNEQEGSHRTNLLDYNEGQVITVLGKEKMTKSTMWYGVIPGGICGMFNPNNTKHYKTPHSRLSVESLSPELEICSPSIPNLLRSDVMRHTYTAKRSVHSDMTSGAQGDYNRTGHIGLDETNFGNISFLDPAGCPPRHVLYRPPVDSEQVPLINPNSPSHLKNSTDTQMPYPPKPNQQRKVDYAEIQITSSQTTTKSRGHKKTTKTKQVKEPVKSKNILKRVKNATIGRSHRKDGNNKKITQNNKNEEVHEYQEITEPETEGNTSENSRPENLITPEIPATQKESSEFRDTLLEEMESILRNIEQRRKDENASDAEGGNRNNGLKKKTPLGTMRQMSAQEEKTLNTAVAMANEITTKSMNDLGHSYNPAAPPNEKHKLNLIKFGQLSLHNHAADENDKDSTGKQERRNFSDEAKAKATDIQSTITKESKAAYACLIEEPTPSTSRMVQVAKTATMPKLSTVGTNNLMPATMPRPATTLKLTTMPRPATTLKPTTMPRPVNTLQPGNMIRPITMLGPPVMPKPVTVSSLDAKNIIDIKTGARPKERPIQKIPILKSLQQKVIKTELSVDETDGVGKNVVNVLPLPPRSEKTLLVDMPRHIRKHPLKIPTKPDNMEPQAIITNHDNAKRITYQNTYSNLDSHVGLNRDGGKFTHKPIKSPTAHLKGFGQTETIRSHGSDDDDVNIIRTLVKDYVSVEDLLEFADLKPCGRQRGFESDEVRIMMKVFYESVTSEQCLEALEFCDWDVHHAIKLLSIKMSVGDYVDLEDCYSELMKARGDITKAVNFLNLQKQCKLLQLST